MRRPPISGAHSRWHRSRALGIAHYPISGVHSGKRRSRAYILESADLGRGGNFVGRSRVYPFYKRRAFDKIPAGSRDLVAAGAQLCSAPRNPQPGPGPLGNGRAVSSPKRNLFIFLPCHLQPAVHVIGRLAPAPRYHLKPWRAVLPLHVRSASIRDE